MTTTNSVNTYIVPTTAHEVTMPSQPAFLAYNSATDNNVTGNGANYTIICDTEVFDQNADYNNGTGIFTAPVTGRYFLSAAALVTGVTVIGISFSMRIITSNRSHNIYFGRVGVANDMSWNFSFITDMDAADTAHIVVSDFGEVGNTQDIVGGATLSTFFSGMLIT